MLLFIYSINLALLVGTSFLMKRAKNGNASKWLWLTLIGGIVTFLFRPLANAIIASSVGMPIIESDGFLNALFEAACELFGFYFAVWAIVQLVRGKKTNNQRGFIQIPILIAIIVSALIFGGGGYFVAHQVEKSQKVATESNSQATTTPQGQATTTVGDIEKLKNEVAELKKKQTTQPKTNTQTKTPTVSTEPNPFPSVAQAPVTIVSTSTQPINNSKHFYQEGRTFWQGLEKSGEHQSAGTNFMGQESSAYTAKNYILAKIYAKSAIDAYDAAYKANLDNTIPFDLPDELKNPMVQMRSIYSEILILSKQMAQIAQSSAEDMEDGYISLASVNSAKEAMTLSDKNGKLLSEFDDISTKWANLLEQYNK